MKAADAFVIAVITAAWAAATVYLFLHPSDTSFGIWCGTKREGVQGLM